MKIIAVLFFIVTFTLTMQAQVNWELRYPLTNNHLKDVVWAGDKFVAVGSNGTICISKDAEHWSSISSFTESDLQCITYTGTKIVASGDSEIFVSPDGYNWEVSSSIKNNVVMSMTWDGEKIWAPTNNGKILTSVDGNSWSVLSTGALTGLYDFAFSDSIKIAVGQGGNLYSSTDGLFWFKRMSGTNGHLNGVIWTGTKFGIIGSYSNLSSYNTSFITSNDGLVWDNSSLEIKNTLNDIIKINDTILAIGDSGTIISTTNLVDWKAVSSSSNEQLNSVAWNGSEAVTVGNNGLILASNGCYNWKKMAPETISLLKVKSFDDISIVVGENGSILTSSDEISWSPQKCEVSNILRDVAKSDSTYLIIGDGGIVLTSTDLKTWIPRIADLSYPEFRSICWTGERFLATTNSSSVFISTDGINWTFNETIYEYGIRSIIWNGSIAVAIGQDANGSQIITSKDGKAWTSQFQGNFSSIIWTGLMFIGYTKEGEVIKSADGITWKMSDEKIDNFIGINIEGVLWADSVVVSVGEDQVNGDKYLWYSKNGEDWVKEVDTTRIGNVNSICWTGNYLLYVDNRKNCIYTSELPSISTGVTNYSKQGDMIKIRLSDRFLLIEHPPLSLSSKITYSMYTLSGRKVMEKKLISQKARFVEDLGMLSNGAYIVNLKIDNIVYNKRIFIR